MRRVVVAYVSITWTPFRNSIVPPGEPTTVRGLILFVRCVAAGCNSWGSYGAADLPAAGAEHSAHGCPGPRRGGLGESPRSPQGIRPIPDDLGPQAGPAGDGRLRAAPPRRERLRGPRGPDGGRPERRLRPDDRRRTQADAADVPALRRPARRPVERMEAGSVRSHDPGRQILGSRLRGHERQPDHAAPRGPSVAVRRRAASHQSEVRRRGGGRGREPAFRLLREREQGDPARECVQGAGPQRVLGRLRIHRRRERFRTAPAPDLLPDLYDLRLRERVHRAGHEDREPRGRESEDRLPTRPEYDSGEAARETPGASDFEGVRRHRALSREGVPRVRRHLPERAGRESRDQGLRRCVWAGAGGLALVSGRLRPWVLQQGRPRAIAFRPRRLVRRLALPCAERALPPLGFRRRCEAYGRDVCTDWSGRGAASTGRGTAPQTLKAPWEFAPRNGHGCEPL